MGYPNRDNRGGSRGGRDFGGRSFGGEKRFRPAELHKATCSNCGNECEVPFKPSGEKPVYCRECFGKMKRSNEEKSFERRDERRSQAQGNPKLDEINSKLDQIIELLNNRTNDLTPETPKVVKKKRVSKKAVELADTPLEEPTTE